MRRPRLPPAAATLAVQGADMASQLVAGVLVARSLGPEAMGHYTFALAVAGILAIVLLFGAGEVAITLYAGRGHDPGAVLEGSLAALAKGPRSRRPPGWPSAWACGSTPRGRARWRWRCWRSPSTGWPRPSTTPCWGGGPRPATCRSWPCHGW